MTGDTQPHWPSCALLTIDVQRDFLSESPYGIAGTTEVLPQLIRLTHAFRLAQRPIVHVVRVYLPDGSNVDISRRAFIAGGAVLARPGTPGVELAQGLTPHEIRLDTDALLRGEISQVGANEFVLYKPRWNAFFGTDLDPWLRARGVDTVAVAGCNFPNCPRGTLFGASERDYRAVAVADAVSGWTSAAEPELAGLGIPTVTTSHVLDELAKLTAPPG